MKKKLSEEVSDKEFIDFIIRDMLELPTVSFDGSKTQQDEIDEWIDILVEDHNWKEKEARNTMQKAYEDY